MTFFPGSNSITGDKRIVQNIKIIQILDLEYLSAFSFSLCSSSQCRFFKGLKPIIFRSTRLCNCKNSSSVFFPYSRSKYCIVPDEIRF